MKIAILVFDGCRNADATEKLVRETVSKLEIDASIEIIKVTNNEYAVAKRFLGSPSVRIDGKDLEVEEDELTQYSMRCRVYRQGDSQTGIPPKDLLVSALSMASRRRS
jgi:hypothetical protein